MNIEDFGLLDYEKSLNRQITLFEKLINAKKEGKRGEEIIMFGEHPNVITVGRRGKTSNILSSLSDLEKLGIKVFHIGRGGDVTFHCPGQLIVYPILDMERHGLGVKQYVDLLENSVISLLQLYGIKGEKIEGATGIWINVGKENERKICAIGIKCNRYCTMHGLALNVTSELSGFSLINPCGFQNKGVTSIEKETEEKIDFEEVKYNLIEILKSKLS